ncbi:lycopene cyclase family protein [Polaribacter sp.]|nr:lycopene cyclase family protein [Polaribacter sp.]MDA9245855.1 lycopene cyclase family protein [Polaribacter sp.]MDA9363180.1 lycopene cyclase family protein [Polaribacter sp.]MDC1353657.1 lycopene cyclase family protein [Polaribacter sp.]MDC1461325.1 lycopene cyclase family protein [Polaribacter sp.]
MKYDYIIAGSGCAGLSLLYSLLQSPSLQYKSILVIDQAQKKNNDRTWCFWEKTPGLFESIVHAKWNTLEFLSTDFKKELDLESYTYKMILGLDFYNFVLNYAQKFENVTFLQETITAIDTGTESAVITTQENSYTARYVFNSTNIFNPEITEQNSLLQHFKGWVIQSEKPVFNPKVGRLMDFSVSQKQGATFMYVLPTSTTKALVEYTLFSPRVLEKETYVTALKKYIKEDLKIDNYTIEHEEFGVIPMSLAKFEKTSKPNVINLGTSGGFTKASSGYTFQFIQKNVAEIVNNLEVGKRPNPSTAFKDKVYQWYDRTLLDVLLTKKLTGKEVFTKIFQKIPAKKILAFLGNESTLVEDISIMKSLPLKPFLGSGIKQL